MPFAGEEGFVRFFTRDLYRRTRSDDDDVLDVASEEWERANEAYRTHLSAIDPLMTPGVREMAGLLLHDAEVRPLAKEGGRLHLALHKDVPPRDLVLLDYDLVGEPSVEAFTDAPRRWEGPSDFQLDELDAEAEGGGVVFTQAIVLGSGWLLRLRFRDVKVTLAQPLAAPAGVPALAGA